MASKKTPTTNEQDCECYADIHTKKSCPPVRSVTHPLRYYEFTDEEIKALEECDKESFYRRCLPFSTILAAGTYYGIRNGYLDTHPHFGPVPKVAVAVLIGYAFGRVVYTHHCEEKLKRLPKNSHLGEVMRIHECERNAPDDPKKKKK